MYSNWKRLNNLKSASVRFIAHLRLGTRCLDLQVLADCSATTTIGAHAFSRVPIAFGEFSMQMRYDTIVGW